jgi:16S rRNA (adenine1518-N6/adenine1519-N6)-dimethyltransferase
LRPLKRLSQNFLIDPAITERILEVAAIQPGDPVIEIGPGMGALTRPLLERGAHVTAIELDDRLIPALRQLPGLHLIHADVLRVDLPKLCKELGPQTKIVANLPYHLTAPILERILNCGLSFSQATLMVQKEVALRCTASPGTKAFGHLTLFLQFYSHPTFCIEVPRHCFDPVPAVDSAVIQLTPHTPPLSDGIGAFFHLTRTAMSQRRKMIRNTLSSLYPPERLLPALAVCNIAPTVRPEQISLSQYLALYKELGPTSSTATGDDNGHSGEA